MANFNLQIRGKKRVWLFSPDDAPYLDVGPSMLNAPFIANSARSSSVKQGRFAEAHCYETTLEPGDAVFIPTFWFHWFVHYPTFQLNMNFWWQAETTALSPISANWVFLSALAKVLGGFHACREEFEKLPDETKKLLRSIEHQILTDATLGDAATMMRARADTPRARVPKPGSLEY
jgi:hypothetical protein